MNINENVLKREVETFHLDRDVEKAEFWKEGYQKGKDSCKQELDQLKNQIKALKSENELLTLRINQ